MRGERLTAFIDATCETFEAMASVKAEPGRCEHGHGPQTGYDVSGLLGLSRLGPCVGSFVLSFPEGVARRAVSRILGEEELPTLDQDVGDGIGELVNVIGGRAKSRLERIGIDDCRTTLPHVVLGSQHRVFHDAHVERAAVSFSSPIGDFLMQILISFPLDRPSARAGAARNPTRGEGA